MSFSVLDYPQDKRERYELILAQADALTDGVNHPIVNLANTAALLYQALDRINWCGFYLMHEGQLLLGPFCGLPACTLIPLGRGVCGTAAAADSVQRIENVHEFPGHIACDSASNSEIVLPIHMNGQVIGVLDIDSPDISRFDAIDEQMLRQLVRLLEARCGFDKTAYHL